MYTLISEASFDSAHFLAGYNGKCRNIHGHRWTLKIEIYSDNLQQSGSCRGMILDFGDLKSELKNITDYYDHALIIEKNSLRESTFHALKEEGFRIIEIDFRPTAENFAKYFYDYFIEKGFFVKNSYVYETPNNCANYSEMR
ncbi:6-carboxytetrahydropterin synthase QueD [uncultured Fusobacterium sp.]|jgi:6-pyruvoyltetrahydropterin/6-carboxytetrahydropterin synthase|uniref:6-carboxytetrahydropterin synthase QueD n=1 Tax=uncultured Fusobacterium sp. TaxID=159267 RepID=UPI0015A4BFC8|nr:6-carboxytetrahydropterin synthase QueD [uncultured Fusobacterium sp.]